MLAINATFIGQFIVLLVLLWFIYKVVVPMLARPIDARQLRIAQGLAAAEEGQQSLAQAQADAEVVIRDAREHAAHIIDQAQKRANELIEQAKGQASVEAARIAASAQTQIELETTRARDALRKDVAGLAVRAASKVLEREIDAKTHAELLNTFAAQI
jgi:F-type H+-transporting ATPase subunit b